MLSWDCYSFYKFVHLTEARNIRFKKLGWFYLSSLGLLCGGVLLNTAADTMQTIVLAACDVSGVFLIYRLNDCIDQEEGKGLHLGRFFSFPIHVAVTAFFLLVLIPLAILFLPLMVFKLLGIGALIGTFYSFSLSIKGKTYRLKNLLLIKNILIGVVWGSLVLIGAGNWSDPAVLSLFLFASVQVVIGSMIRDVPDREKDEQRGVRSFPVVMGNKRSIRFMHLLNVSSLASAAIYNWNSQWITFFLIIILYRAINLIMLERNPDQLFWSQKGNLLTCVLIPIILFAFLQYGVI